LYNLDDIFRARSPRGHGWDAMDGEPTGRLDRAMTVCDCGGVGMDG